MKDFSVIEFATYLKNNQFSLDLAKLAQQHPTTKVRFQLIDIHQAQQAKPKLIALLSAQQMPLVLARPARLKWVIKLLLLLL
jgi:hypothetical protein